MTASLPADCFRSWFHATIGSRYLLSLQLRDVYSTTSISLAHLELLSRQSGSQVAVALAAAQAVLLQKLRLEQELFLLSSSFLSSILLFLPLLLLLTYSCGILLVRSRWIARGTRCLVRCRGIFRLVGHLGRGGRGRLIII